MKAVIQRVTSASVEIDGEVAGQIGTGYLILLGIGAEDTEADIAPLADKIIKLRIFADEQGKTNRSLADVDGGLLIISQFTLYADCSHGNRPNFLKAGKPDAANTLYEAFLAYCRTRVGKVECGWFGADMKVSLVNDGPFTICLDSADFV